MNNQSVLKMYYRDKWTWFLIPTIILFSVFLLNFIVSLFIQSDEKFYTGGVSYIFVYMFVMGIIVVAQTFPYAIGMSIRRTDYFLGTAVMGIVINILFAVMLVILSVIENSTNGWGGRFHFFHFPYLNDGTIMEQFLTYIILFFNLFFLGLVISSITRRYGGKGLIIAAIASILITSVIAMFITYYGVWMDIFRWIASHPAVEIAYWLILPTLLFMWIPYLLLRRSTI